jgi:non-heme chloroperoxidase
LSILPSTSSAEGGDADCVPAWTTDFRVDLPKITIPMLLIHGDSDRILPIEATAIPYSKAVKSSRLVQIPGGPHGIPWTHAGQVNAELVGFLGKKAQPEREFAETRR